MVKLSIIIPYYKTYDLTVKLLEVLIPQLTEEVEVFLVDDGCNEVRLDKYSDYIEINHLEKNQGVSKSRNEGIKKSKGKYIGFIDSDDLITSDYIQTLLDAINVTEADLIYMDWVDMHSGDIIHRPSNFAPWRSLYKKNILPLFNENIRHSEDVPFQDAVDSHPRTKYYTDKVLYIYNSGREGSLTWEKKRGDYS